MCEHKQFQASVSVTRLEDVKRFVAEVRIVCKDCGVPMQFMGLQTGYNMDSAMVSLDGTEARLGICPMGEIPTPVQQMAGSTSRPN